MHILIPMLIMLVVFPKVNKKLAIGLALLALVPDLDFFIDFTHRFLMHNIFFTTGLSLIIYFFTKDMKIFLMSLYYLTSHLILDLTVGAVALFYPLYQRLIEVTVSLNSKWILDLSIQTHPLMETSSYFSGKPSYFFTKIGVITLAFLVMMIIIKYRKSILKLN